jgi:hydrogenase maturation protease
MVHHRPSILIATCGNVIASDDVLGPCVASEVRRLDLPGVEMVNLDNQAAALMKYLPGKNGLILVDTAYESGLEPGRVSDTDWFRPDRLSPVYDDTITTHRISVSVQLDLAERLGLLPQRVRMITTSVELARAGQPTNCRLPGLIITASNLVIMHAERWSASILERQYA